MLYPSRFEPIYQYRLWGGRRLANLLSAPLPADGPIGEAWVLTDRADHQSQIANGPLKGQTLGQVMKQFPESLMGSCLRVSPTFLCCSSFWTRTRCFPCRSIPTMHTRT